MNRIIKAILLIGVGLAITAACDLFDDIRVAIEVGAEGEEAFLPPEGFTVPGTAAPKETTAKKKQTDEAAADTDAGSSSKQKTKPPPVYFSIGFDNMGAFDTTFVVKEFLKKLQASGQFPKAEQAYDPETGILDLSLLKPPDNYTGKDPKEELAERLEEVLLRIENPALMAAENPTMGKCKGQKILAKNEDGKNILTLVLPADVVSAKQLDPSGKLEHYKGIIDQIRITETELLFNGADKFVQKKASDRLPPSQVNTLNHPISYAAMLVFDVTPPSAKQLNFQRFPTPTSNTKLSASEIQEPVDPICQGGLLIYGLNNTDAKKKWVENRDFVTLFEIPLINQGEILSEKEALRKFTFEEVIATSDTLKNLNFQIAFRLDIDLTQLVDSLNALKTGAKITKITLPSGGLGIRLRYHAYFVTCPQQAALGSNKSEDIKCAE